MCGNATLTIELSSTSRIAQRITDAATIHLRADSAAWAICGCCTAAAVDELASITPGSMRMPCRHRDTIRLPSAHASISVGSLSGLVSRVLRNPRKIQMAWLPLSTPCYAAGSPPRGKSEHRYSERRYKGRAQEGQRNSMMGGMEAPSEQQSPTATRRVHERLLQVIEDADALVYALVGVVFLAGAFGMLGYSVAAFPANLRDTGFALAIVTLV